MLESLRSRIYGVLADDTGNFLLPVRLARGAVLYANDVVGRPLASKDELVERREFYTAQSDAQQAREIALSEQAPVVVFHIERLPNELKKVGDILDGEGVKFTVRNIADDEAAISAARMDSDNARFPMVFIAGDFIGGAEALTNMLRGGELKRRVFGG